MLIPVNKLPSNFKPYDFKSFTMKAINAEQAINLGPEPTLMDIRKLIQTLVNDEIDASKLVPIDLKYLVAMLAFHAYPKQSWTLKLTCPECGHPHTKVVEMKDFPPVPSLSDDDPYPLTIDDGKHVYELGYASVEAISGIEIGKSENIDVIAAHIISIDGNTDDIKKKLLEIEDFGVLGLMYQAILKYFEVETYAEFKCPKCEKTYKVAMSAIEVTQYTPFLDEKTPSRYKTNFRL